MELFLRQLRAWNFGPANAVRDGTWKRFSGDLVSLGKGEILTWQR
jgi:hypothetical protein